jgi:flagellar P-ring protein precursor FlgI
MRWVVVALALLASLTCASAEVRIKDITSLRGMRDNQLVGYGLVVGLSGTGDSFRNATFTDQALQSMLDRMGISTKTGQSRPRNVAAVIVTADLPPLLSKGTRLDVTVSSLGDATSLMGGTLILTPLTGPDGMTYAVAQGQVSISGFAATGQAESLTQGVPTAGRIVNGAIIERQVPGVLADLGNLVLELKNPDFKTAIEVVDAINGYTRSRYGMTAAREQDNRNVLLNRPAKLSTVRFMSEIGDLLVQPDLPARVVIDARTGTIVIGQDAQISTVAVTHGNITVRVTETPNVSQPLPRSNGQTTVTPQTNIGADQAGGQMAIVGGSNLRQLVRGLNQIGLKPSGIISILQAIKTAGALQAELVVQ